MGLFGKDNQKSPKDMVNEWNHKLRKEGYVLERQIKAIQREEEKTKRQLKDSAKKGEKAACSILAKEILNSRKAVNRLYASKAHLNSISMNMKNQLATLRIAGALEKSTDVMKSMQALIKLPEIQRTMMEMSKEMMKAGIIEEMLEDTMEGLEDSDEMEEAAQEEVDKVLYELTAGELGKAPTAVTDTLPAMKEPEGATAATSDDEAEDLMAKLEALRS
ncbi:charged multivesicular body protein 3-like [Ruditapes philippinarum]|uniref:charged multivesicular body protein 3-like n=1 Tax=Ruditapes philippinarum TaxID=129788 RepID=UPI00295BF718|nr:charged multivesicular body protein 3-like [Ruditapes philippinarum]